MKIRVLRWPLAAALTFLLLACGITWLLPDWEQDLGTNNFRNFLYTGQDGQSLFNIGLRINENEITVEHLDLNGNLLDKQTLVPPIMPGTGGVLVRGLEDDFYLYADNLGAGSNQVLYVDPASANGPVALQTSLPANQTVRVAGSDISAARINSAGKLLFSGFLVTDPNTDAESSVIITGLMNQQGQLEKQLSFPDLTNIDALHPLNNGHFQLVARTNQSPATTAFIELDDNLNLVQRHDRPIRIHYIVPSTDGNTLLMAYNTKASRLSLTGEELQSGPLADYVTHIYPTSDGFFTFHISNYTTCFYNLNLQQQWCSKLDFIKDDFRLVRGVQVTAENELLVSIDSGYLAVTGGKLRSEIDPAAIEAGFSIIGEQRYDMRHILYSATGKRVAHAKAQTFKQRGRIYLCGVFDLCTEPEAVQPGVCRYGHQDTLTLPGRRVYTMIDHCDQFPDPAITRQLLHWQP